MKYRVYYVNNPKKTRALYEIREGNPSDDEMWEKFLNFELKVNEEVEDFDGEFIND